MLDCKTMSTPMETNLHKLKEAVEESRFVDPTLYKQIIGSLMYLINTHPKIFYVVNALSQFICKPWEIHLVSTKNILRRLQDIIGYGPKYKKWWSRLT